MALSSVSVVTSSLTLKWWKRPKASVMPGKANGGVGDEEGVQMKEGVRNLTGEAWETVKGWVRGWGGVGDRSGYQQLPLEMASV